MARLVLDAGTPAEKSFAILPGRTSIGRAADMDVVLTGKGVSRVHAEIHTLGDRMDVVDLQSSNGTYVNEQRVERGTVALGDVLRFGSVELLVASGASEESKPLYTSTTHTLFSVSDELVQPTAGASKTERQLATLLQVSQLLAATTSLETALERILRLGLEILPIDRAVILLGDTPDALVLRAAKSRRPDSGAQRIWSRKVVAHVMNQDVAALFQDVSSDVRIPSSESVFQQGIVSSMCAPLKIGQQSLGVLYADSLDPERVPGRDDLDLLGGIASQGALAISNAMLQERLRSEAVAKQALLRFFPAPAAEQIMSQGERELAVVETTVTVLFCDISGYTQLTTGMSPREVHKLLNEYFPLVTRPVFEHGGTLEKYIGDAILAIWGAPLPIDDAADRAVAAAKDMLRAVQDKRFGIHIGLHTGPVAAGNIGTPDYLQYAAVGETTNLASRIAGVAASGEIVISAATLSAHRDARPTVTQLDPVSVKGYPDPLQLYQVLTT